MFKKLFLALSFISLNSQTTILADTATGKTYGFCVRNLIPDVPAFEQFEEIEAAAQIPLEWLGNEMETGEMVWAVEDLAQAKQVQNLLVKAGYAVDILDVIFDDAPNANVMSAQAQIKIAEQLNELMKSLGN
jgi:hypothetical protein